LIVQSLDGQWKLCQAGSSDLIHANVPGCVHLDLMSAGLIPDPFQADNEYRVTWVHETDWEYSRTFAVTEEVLACDRVYLECDGLDTLARISVNGTPLAETANMYVAYRFDVREMLRPGENRIEVLLKSPVNHVQPLLEQDPLQHISMTIPGASYVRKSPSQWGWDWGPKLPSSGIWRSIRLAGYTGSRISDLRVRQDHANASVELLVEAQVEHLSGPECSVKFRLTHPDGRSEEHTAKLAGSKATCTIPVTDPQLWWPNGHGSQPLYTVEAVVECSGEITHSMRRRIGLRSIELNQSPDEFGRKFTFVVNGVPIFCKGADWVPADQFPSRLTRDHYEHLIRSAALANMNMLRVWGGGFYEDECFYDLCDEYGVLIWQDFMFSCSLYPDNAEFLGNVRCEAEHNITRLRNHACLALWCGNNEMEWFLAGSWGGERNAERREQYSTIFHELLPSVVSEFDPDTNYWPSSPYSQEPFVDPNSEASGDGHYWDVWHGKLPFTAYREHYFRFMSEFGFESLPAYETCKAFASPDQLNITSHVMECHQKNDAGNGLILHYMAQTFRFPKDFEMMCYTSQLLQAEAMRYGVEHWRRNRGRCMGTLYWQFNDCWPVCSWAGVDYYGRWKALNYFARRFYSPILLSVCEDGDKASIHVTNDTLGSVRVNLRWSLESLEGRVIRQGCVKSEAQAESDTTLASLDFSKELTFDTRRRTVLVTELLVDGQSAGFTVTAFVPSKHLELPTARISLSSGRDDQGCFIELSSDRAARYVCIEIPGADVILSDNYFDLPAGRKAVVRVESEVDSEALAGARAYSLRDSY